VKFAICNETFQDWPLDKAFRLAKESGYGGIEFAPFTLGADAMSISGARRAEVRRHLEQAGLQAIGLHWLLAKTEGYYLTSPDRAVQVRTGLYLSELARLCADLGGHLMVLGSPQQRNLLPGVTHEQAMEIAAATIRRALPALDGHGVTLALEPLGPSEGDFLLTAAKAIELAQQIDSPRVRLHLDVKAMSSEERPIPQIIEESADYLVHFHANDPNKRGPGMGDVDFLPILQALHKIKYGGWVSVEVFDYEPGIERLTCDSIRYLQQCERQLPS
jgi:sugar phosphate isomerase/epimerase